MKREDEGVRERELIEQCLSYIKQVFSGDASGHDYHHTLRVLRWAERLAKEEGAELLSVQLAALLHDVDDFKLSPETHENKDRARAFMKAQGLDEELINRVCHIIDEVSFGGESKVPSTLEGACVQDADRLDALGAVGIARCFAYGGSKGLPMHDPDIKPRLSMTKEEYRSAKSTSINHFYEKLFKLPALMNTESARLISEKRAKYMEDFIDRFMKEWNCD